MGGGFNALSSNLTKDASKQIFVATGILVFDFELLIGGRYDISDNIATAEVATMCFLHTAVSGRIP